MESPSSSNSKLAYIYLYTKLYISKLRTINCGQNIRQVLKKTGEGL